MAVNVKMGVDTSTFKSNIQDATAQLKTFDAQLKNAEATMKATGNAEQGLTQKMNALTGKLETQKRMAQQYAQQLEKMRTAGVDPLSKEYQKLAAALLNADTGIKETQAQLDNLTTSENKAADGADKLTQSVNSISRKVSLDQVITGISAITSGLENAAKKAISFGEKLFDVIVDAAAEADDISTMATRLGLTEEEIQQINYNAARFEVTAEQLGKTWKKVKNNMASDSDDIVEAFKEIGVQTHDELPGKFGDVVQNARDYKDVFWEIGEALLHLDDATKQEALANKLLGRSWDELLPLFTEGRDAYEEAMAAAPTASQEAIDNLAAFNDRLNELEQSWNVLKIQVLGEIAPALEKGADAIATLLDKLTAYLQTDKGQELLTNLGNAVSALFEDLANIDPDKVVTNFSKLFNGVVSSFEWLTEHWGEVKDALVGIAIGFGALKIATLALNIGKVISGLGGLLGGGGGGAEAAQAVTGGGAGSYTAKNLASRVAQSGLGVAATSAASTIASSLTMYDPTGTAAFLYPAVMDMTTYGINRKSGKSIGESLKAQWDEIAQGFSAESIAASADAAKEYWLEKVPNAFWGVLGFKDAKDAAQQATEVLHKATENLQTAGEWTLSDDLTADELMALVSGENKVEIPAEIVPDENAAEDIADKVGDVTIPVTLEIRDVEGAELWELLNGPGSSGGTGFANGLAYVPNNGLYRLHRGEQVLPAREVASRSYSSNLYVESMVMNNGTDAEGLASAMAAAQRRTMSGYGS